ncbi:hypothetical protein CG709_20140, partial [Lachnotalea glycerini]
LNKVFFFVRVAAYEITACLVGSELCLRDIYLFHLLILQYVNMEATSALSMITMVVIPIFLLKTRKMEYFLLYPFIVIGSSVIGVSFSFLLATILNIPEHIIAKGNWYTILCQSIQSIVLVIVAGYRKLRKKENFQVSLDWKQYVLFYIVVVCLFFMLAPIQGLTQKYSSDQYINLSGLFVSIACIVLVIVTIWQGIIVNREIQLKELNKKNEEYIKLQKEYYENLLKQDEKMRRFHHDLNTHIMVIKAQCQNGDYNELEDYLKCIVEESGVFSVESYTGNKNVDAVLRQLFVQAKEQHIKIEIDGSLPIKTRISEFDLCPILSNLVTNAIESCEKLNESSIRNIKILTNAYNEQIFISVKNTITGNIILKENHLITAKEDKKNHGIG